MARSYSEHPYNNPKKDTHLVHDERDMPEVDAQYTEAAPAGPEPKIHYGKKFAQTEEMLIAKQMNRQLEELSGITAEEQAKREATRTTAELPEPPQVQKSAPIGALPLTEEPLPAMPQGVLREILETATTDLQLVRAAARDLWVASFRLARLPLDAARVAVRHLRPQTA